jgi:hypothetical protein
MRWLPVEPPIGMRGELDLASVTLGCGVEESRPSQKGVGAWWLGAAEDPRGEVVRGVSKRSASFEEIRLREGDLSNDWLGSCIGELIGSAAAGGR